MLVKYLDNKTTLMTPGKDNPSISDALEKGAFYVVYALGIKDGLVSYEILSNDKTITHRFPGYLFEVVDNRLSRYFAFGNSITGDNEPYFLITFKEWADDPFFYARLFDGEK